MTGSLPYGEVFPPFPTEKGGKGSSKQPGKTPFQLILLQLKLKIYPFLAIQSLKASRNEAPNFENHLTNI